MGTRNWHIARAEYHRKVADHLATQTPYPDWALVALYYSALHYVDSVLADDPDLPKDERNPRKHSGIEVGSRGRNQLVKARMRVIQKHYRSLEEISRRTRYDVERLDGLDKSAFHRMVVKWGEIERYATLMHLTRPEISSEAP